MALVYKILGDAEWRAAEAGVFSGSEVDLSDGYIHFSTAAQAAETAGKWFAGRADLWLVAIEAEALGGALRWEFSRGGGLFPHLYGELPISKVVWARKLPLGAAGQHDFGGLEG